MKGEILITQEQILERAREIGTQISEELQNEEVILLGILKGSVPWIGDLMKNITLENMVVDFMACSSYGSSTRSSGTVRIVKDIEEDVLNKVIVIVEDIIDSGITLNYLKSYLKHRGAKDVKVCTLLDKPEGRQVEVEVDYVGFSVENRFIIGYGLDYDQKYRQLPYISCLD